ncbi:MAG TPA: hypothetical protein VFD59_04050 [Nocardioidaceae bacterium]|nr:hypothetical protein [Nocardioidaceae bacterium]
MTRTRVPWPLALTAGTAAALVVVVALAYPAQGVSSFVVRISELLLACGAAYLIDDAAAAVTATAPRTVWRRRAPTFLGGAGLLAVTWIVILVVLSWQAPGGPRLAITWEVVVLCCLAIAAAAVIARLGEPEPGGQVAPVVLLLGVSALLTEPVLGVTIFVPDEGKGGVARQLWWTGAAVLALVTVLVASRDPATGRGRHGVRLVP